MQANNPKSSKRLLCLIRSDLPITQRPEDVLNFLLEGEEFDEVVCVRSRVGISKINISIVNHALRIDLPSSIPVVSSLQQKGSSFSMLTWLETIIKLKIMFRKTKFNVCWTGELVPASMGRILKLFRICDKIVYDDPDYYPICYSGISSMFAKILESAVIKSADLLISISPEIARIREQQGAKAVCTIPHGVDYAFFGKAVEERLPRISAPQFKPKVILFAGNFADELRNDLVLQALKRVYETQKRLPPPSSGRR